MNRSELVEAVMAESGVTRDTVAKILKAFENIVIANVSKGEKIALSGFLSFELVERKARIARNPQTGEAIHVAASRAPKVSTGSTFRKTVKSPSSPVIDSPEPQSNPSQAPDFTPTQRPEAVAPIPETEQE